MLPRAIAPVSGALAPLRPSGMGFGGDTPGLPEHPFCVRGDEVETTRGGTQGL